MDGFEREVAETANWLSSPRFQGLPRLYSARDVVEQRGTIQADYGLARNLAEEFYARLRELFAEGKAIITFGPYSPSQAVVMKRIGIEGIYLGGWATSAKGSRTEDPGADLASYPLSQVPDEAASIVRALLTADKNQRFARSRMSEKERAEAPEVDYRPFIVADADTGHGGDAHVRNLIRRFAEVGVCGYHIEDQKPGCKKCGHQGGKVLVPQDEQIKRLNAARFQLDVMGVPGILIARTDAEAATLLDGRGDERDHPFLLGATRVDLPSFKAVSLAVLKALHDLGVKEVNGHLLYKVPDSVYEEAYRWLERFGLMSAIEDAATAHAGNGSAGVGAALEEITTTLSETWEIEAGLKTYGQAVADAMAFHIDEGLEFDMNVDEWLEWSSQESFPVAREKAKSMGVNVIWDCELSRTPEGYYPIKGGIEYAIARSLNVAPFADLVWMETKTADLADAKQFAKAIHAEYPEQMLAYNLSPSFNWDTTGMTDEEMKRFPKELGKLGYVFNFITYGGHQVDGTAAEEFATALTEEGMLALARLQRKIRLLESPYKTPQTLVGGSRLDAALMACTGRTATTGAMGKGSTQVQHLVQTEVPPSLLEKWLVIWTQENQIPGTLRVELRPHTAGSELLEINILNEARETVANVIFATIQDRSGRTILSIRDQNTFDTSLRKKRLMTLVHLFLIHRYKIVSVHYLTPTDDNQRQTEGMKAIGIFDQVNDEVGEIIVADVNAECIQELVDPDQGELKKLISRSR
jgi:isocitrate lyase